MSHRFRLARRWHRFKVGRYKVSWYLGGHSGRGYGWRLRGDAVCLGPVFVSVWKRVQDDPAHWKEVRVFGRRKR